MTLAQLFSCFQSKALPDENRQDRTKTNHVSHKRKPAASLELNPFEEKMKAAGLSDSAIASFAYNYEQLMRGVTGMVRRGAKHLAQHPSCRAPFRVQATFSKIIWPRRIDSGPQRLIIKGMSIT